MEGLEAVEVKFSESVENNRIDSEFYKKEFYQYEQSLKDYSLLKDIGDFLIGPFGSTVTTDQYVEESENLYIRGVDIGNFFLNDPEAKISNELYKSLPRFHVCKNDIFITVVGTLGKVAIITDPNIRAVFSCKSTIFRSKINPYFVTTFLNTNLGYQLLLRWKRGAVQEGLNLPDLQKIRIPKVSPEFQKGIERLVVGSQNKREESKALYKEAETTLLSALGLTDYTPTEENTNIKSLSESFGESGRLDAEHYEKKFDQIVTKLRDTGYDCPTIGRIAPDIINGAEVREYEETGVPYLRVGDLKDLNINESSVVFVNPVSAEKGLQKIGLTQGDVLVSRSGSLAVTAVVEKQWKSALISSHLIRVPIIDKRINPYYLALFLGLLPGKMQIQQRSNGGVQPEINQPALKAIIVPVIPSEIQKKIEECITGARILRDESRQLLDLAKRSVEVAIEDGEHSGMSLLRGGSDV